MKIKKEEIKEEDINAEEIDEEEIKNEDVESSFRATLSRFSYPLSPPSARRPPKRPSPGSNPNPPPSASLSVTDLTVAVAQPTPVRQDEGNNDESIDSGAVQALRRSPRKRKGETRPILDAGDGDSGGGTRPSKKMKKMRRGLGNPRAPEVDLSRFGALPEYLAEDLDGTFLPPNLHKMIICSLSILSNTPFAVPPFLFPLESPHSALLWNQVREFLSHYVLVPQLVDSKHHKVRGVRLL